MFAVMGITGNVGGAVADTLLQHGKKVRGIVRNASKARTWQEKDVEIVMSDYDNHLTAALSGVEDVFGMIPTNMVPEPGFPDSVVRIAAIKKAVLAAKPTRAVFLSSWGSEKTSGIGMITANRMLEQELGDTGVPNAFLRPVGLWRTLRIGFLALAPRATTSLSTSRWNVLTRWLRRRTWGGSARKYWHGTGRVTALSRSPARSLIPARTLPQPWERRSAAPSPR